MRKINKLNKVDGRILIHHDILDGICMGNPDKNKTM